MNASRIADSEDIVVSALIKGEERYVITFRDTAKDRADALRSVGRWASDPNVSFTCGDAAQLAQGIREGGAA